MDLEIDSDLVDMLGWRSAWFDLIASLQEEARRMRRVRPLLPSLDAEGLDPDAIADLTVDVPQNQDNVKAKATPISIPARQRLVSAEIGCEFQLTNEQVANFQIVKQLVTKAAQQVALAEDALLLIGDQILQDVDTEPIDHTRRSFRKLSIEHRNLDQQTDRLLRQQLLRAARDELNANLNTTERDNLPEWLKAFVISGNNFTGELEDILHGKYLETDGRAEKLLDAERGSPAEPCFGYGTVDPGTILDSILQGISDLQERGHYGEYCVLVDPRLYQAAYTPKPNDITSAPIYQIMPRLREGGFGYSLMMPPKTGIVWSLGGNALGVAVPREPHLVFIRKDRDVILSVQERVRLIVNEPRAVAQLENPR